MVRMDLLLLAVAGVLVIVTVTSVAGRIGVAAPLLLVVAGVGISFLPGMPRIEVPPEAILAGVLPPLLYAASVNMPAVDFRRDFKAISGLSVVLVLVSALSLGWLLPRLIPGIGFAEAFALGAIVSPTDAVATSIVRRTGVAPRLVTVLDGESLLNDATALVLLRTAVAATGASVSFWHVGLDFVQAVGVAVVVGVLVAVVSLFVRSLVEDATVATSISFVVPFLAYAPSEHLGGSGVVAVVVAGLVIGSRSLVELRADDRIAEAVNWRTIAFLLEGAVFLVMGLELRPRRLRDAANLWAAVRDRQGPAARDAAWTHPDLMPTAADLDDPLGFASGESGDDDFDAALDELLSGEAGDGTPGRDDEPGTGDAR